MHLIHRCQQGFTTVTLMGVLMVGGLLIAATFAAVDPDISQSRVDQDRKQAYGAAEAGLQWYLSRLGQDNSFYVHCTNVGDPAPGEPAPVNQKWNGVGKDPRVWRKLPGESAQYTVELMPVTGFSSCVEGNQYSMIDPSGNMRLRISGRSRGEVRTILATLRRQNLIDYIWFTDYETLPAATYESSSDIKKAAAQCGTYRDLRASFCVDISFIRGDNFKGPFHTNDSAMVCDDPIFGRTPRDAIEIVGEPHFIDGPSCGHDEQIEGTEVSDATVLEMPASNAELANIADPAYRFSGKTTIELSGLQMVVQNTAKFGAAKQTMNLPPNGVIYVSNKVCTAGFTRTQYYSTDTTNCGDVWLRGTYDKDLTIAAQNDIVINGDVKRPTETSGALLGLVANNFVRLYHPTDSDCKNKANALKNPVIEAAILTLQQSWIADNWFCGAPLGKVRVFGAIAQRYRGTVGTHDEGTPVSGYIKDYEYNDRLRYREPPYFLDPVQASWRISRETEQLPSVRAR